MLKTVEDGFPELLKCVEAGQLPSDAKARVTFDDAATVPSEATAKDAALVLFEQWDQENAQLTPEARAENDRVYDEIEKNGIPRFRL